MDADDSSAGQLPVSRGQLRLDMNRGSRGGSSDRRRFTGTYAKRVRSLSGNLGLPAAFPACLVPAALPVPTPSRSVRRKT